MEYDHQNKSLRNRLMLLFTCPISFLLVGEEIVVSGCLIDLDLREEPTGGMEFSTHLNGPNIDGCLELSDGSGRVNYKREDLCEEGEFIAGYRGAMAKMRVYTGRRFRRHVAGCR